MTTPTDPVQSEEVPDKASLSDMVDEPVKVHVEPHGDAEVDIDADGADADDLDIEIHAGQHADVTVNVENTAPKGGSIKGDDKGLVIPRWVQFVLNPFTVLALMLMPVVAWFFVSDSSPRGFMGLMIVSVVGWLVLMVALYEWARSYYKYISKSVGKAEGVEIVSSVAGGLSEAFPAAIIALGIGGTAAYLENQYHQNELMLEDANHQHAMLLQTRQWNHEQTRTLLEELTSKGYGSLYILKSAKERIVWLVAANNAVSRGDAERADLVFPPDGRSYTETLMLYEQHAKEYSTGKSLDSILAGIIAHYSIEQETPEDADESAKELLRIKSSVLEKAEFLADKIAEVERFSNSDKMIAPDDRAVWAELNKLTAACDSGINALRDEIHRYIAAYSKTHTRKQP